MTTLKPRKPLREWRRLPRATVLAHHSNRVDRALALREMRADIEWFTPSGVPFAWIGRNPPAPFVHYLDR